MDLVPVQPVGSHRGWSRARTVLSLAVPLVLLVGIVGAGFLGRLGDPAPGPRPAADVARLSPSPRPEPARPAGALEDAGFPTRTIELDVLSVQEMLDRRDAGLIADEVVAVGGWLTIPPAHGCPEARAAASTMAAADLLCRRGTFLLDAPEPLIALTPDGARDVRAPGRHLRPQALPGLDVTAIAGRQYHGLEVVLRPVPVVLAGRFGDARLAECRTTTRRCARTFAIERVLWIDGEPQLRRAERYPGLDDVALSRLVRWHIVDEATRQGSTVLSEVVVPRSELARLDPDADRLVPRDVAGPVWYVRTMLRDGPDGEVTGEVGWAVIEDATALVLAAEPDGRSARADGSPP